MNVNKRKRTLCEKAVQIICTKDKNRRATLKLYTACFDNDTKAASEVFASNTSPDPFNGWPGDCAFVRAAHLYKNRAILKSMMKLPKFNWVDCFVSLLGAETFDIAILAIETKNEITKLFNFDEFVRNESKLVQFCWYDASKLQFLVSRGLDVCAKTCFFGRSCLDVIKHRLNDKGWIKHKELYTEMYAIASREAYNKTRRKVMKLLYDDVPESGMLTELLDLALEYHEL